jgi:exonuclease VII small subunit
MNIDINKQEAWRLLDAIESYQKDYSVTAASTKSLDNVKKKLKQIVNETKEKS